VTVIAGAFSQTAALDGEEPEREHAERDVVMPADEE
jgi:hypothetical protein